jgi:quercetin dioxygenase-like cupin family protein
MATSLRFPEAGTAGESVIRDVSRKEIGDGCNETEGRGVQELQEGGQGGATRSEVTQERLRPHPSDRLLGPAVLLDLPDLAKRLRAEPHPAKDGHRQAGLVHRGPLRLILFTLEPGARLPEHRAPGHVLIHCIRGALAVQAGGTRHRVGTNETLALEPDVPHDVEAVEESDMLLTVCLL